MNESQNSIHVSVYTKGKKLLNTVPRNLVYIPNPLQKSWWPKAMRSIDFYHRANM